MIGGKVWKVKKGVGMLEDLLPIGILSIPKKLFGYRIQNTVFFSRRVWWVKNIIYNMIIVYILYNIIYYRKSYRAIDMSKGTHFKNCILYSVSQRCLIFAPYLGNKPSLPCEQLFPG